MNRTVLQRADSFHSSGGQSYSKMEKHDKAVQAETKNSSIVLITWIHLEDGCG